VHPAFKGFVFGPNYPATVTDPTAFVDTSLVLGPPPPGKLYGITRIRRNNVQTAGATPSNEPDSDGGLTAASRPYFYSAGPDGDPSTVADNIYLTVPRVSKN